MAESSEKNPEKIFSFQLTPIIKLKQSIKSLSDLYLNPPKLGRLDLTEKGFEITVTHPRTKVVRLLFLNSTGLINFHCSKPVVNKIINLRETSHVFDDYTDEDTVTVFHLVGSNSLTFILGSAPDKELKIEFLERKIKIDKFPNIKLMCEAVLASETLRQMIERLEERKSKGKFKEVSVDMSKGVVTISIGQDNPWTYKYNDDTTMSSVSTGEKDPWDYKYYDDKIIGMMGIEPWQKHHREFNMHHLKSLKAASLLTPFLRLGFLTKPVGYIMMRFSLREVGDLLFIDEVVRGYNILQCSNFRQSKYKKCF